MAHLDVPARGRLEDQVTPPLRRTVRERPHQSGQTHGRRLLLRGGGLAGPAERARADRGELGLGEAVGPGLGLVAGRAALGAIAFNQDGSRVAAGDDAVKVWRTGDGSELATYDLPGDAAAVGFRGEDVCAVSSKGAACFSARGAVPIEGARAPTRAAAITSRWIASGTYDAIEVRGADGSVRATIPGRAYAVVGLGDDLWAILVDSAIPVRSGVVAPPVILKLPSK